MATTKKPARTKGRAARRKDPVARKASNPVRSKAPPVEPEEGAVTAEDLSTEDLEALALAPITRIPILIKTSGLYEWSRSLIPVRPIPVRPVPIPRPIPAQPLPMPGQPGPIPSPGGVAGEGAIAERELEAADVERAGLTPILFQREELRLDVDGKYPQMVASGTIYGGMTYRIHWVANLTRTGTDHYTGPIWYKDGDASWLQHTHVTIAVTRSFFANQRKATVVFEGGPGPARARVYDWRSSYFHPVEFEFDTAGVAAITQIDTGDHPNRPSSLPVGPLSIESVYRQVGVNVTVSPYSGPIPMSPGPDDRWSDMEMHDAMQLYWKRFADKPQWAMWVLFARLHEQGTSLGGIMFDDIGPNHRQGSAIFYDSFIKNPPMGDPAPDAWVRRMKFWTAVHEIGHAFNLAHSWQKAMVYQGHGPWIPLLDDPEARSFMNYPYNVSGGQAAFFADFQFRFTDSELLFLRHAPERFVEMGNAEWFDHHGFEQTDRRQGSPYKLELRVHRDVDHFEFMEPVMAELKLSNQSTDPIIVDRALLESTALTVVVRRQGMPAKLWRPYAERCSAGAREILMPRKTPDEPTGEAVYAPLKLVGGVGGWAIDEPGRYSIQVALRVGDEDVVSNLLEIRVAPPRSFDEQHLAQEFFTEDVGRVLTFAGTRVLDRANEALQTVTTHLSGHRVAHHALYALAHPWTRRFRWLDTTGAVPGAEDEPAGGLKFNVLAVDAKAATKEMKTALMSNPAVAAETFGHIGYREKIEHFGRFLAEEEGQHASAAQYLDKAAQTLKARGVIASVLKKLKDQAGEYKG